MILIDIRDGILNSPTKQRGPRRRDRSAQNAAGAANKTAGTTAGTYGSAAGGIGSTLVPFETKMLTNPTGESQQDIGAQITQRLAGAGGATAGLSGAASKMGATTRNPNGFESALDAAARERMKAGAGVGSDIAAENAKIKLGQQSDAAKTLGGLYNTDVEGQIKSQGEQADDINAQTKAGSEGWLQNGLGLVNALSGAARAYKPGGFA